MSIKEFEELDVFKKARELSKCIYSFTDKESFRKDFGLKDQLRRASVSILSNIAEGFERGTNSEFAQFLYIARGSSAEVRAQLIVALDQGYLDKEQYRGLTNNCKIISKMLNGLIHYLKTSTIKKRNRST